MLSKLELELQLKKVVQTIVELENPKAVYLFGSYAYGEVNENSDVDICIIRDRVDNEVLETAKIRGALFHVPLALDFVMVSLSDFEKKKSIWWTMEGQVYSKGVNLYSNER